MLTLEIEFLGGVCFAARSQSSPEADWPLQPDRVFSALVATWGVRGGNAEERTALEWLEAQDPPQIEASGADARRVGVAYVPPNDPSVSKVEILPERRSRQARFFPAAIPEVPLLRLCWSVTPSPAVRQSLERLAQDTSYLGHSTSLVRCYFREDAPEIAGLRRQTARRRVSAGRLSALERAYQAGRRPEPGEPWEERVQEPSGVPQSIFGREWIVFEDAGGWSPDIRASAMIGRRVRDALMSHFPNPTPEFVSGHQLGGAPSEQGHLAIVSLADVGFEYSEGRVMGFALVLPRNLELERLTAQRQWLAGLTDGEPWRNFDRAVEAIRELEFSFEGEKRVWQVRRLVDPTKASLEPGRYLQARRRWISATPMVLDRHLKAKDLAEREREVEEIVATACEHIGLPAPETVRLNKHSGLRGVPGATPSGNAPRWTGWKMLKSLEHRMLTHAVVTFPEPVRGPVILGAGRFTGLGLFLPLRGEGE